MSVNCFRYFHLHLISSKRSSQSAQYINHHCQHHSSQPGDDRGSLFASNGSQIKAPVSQLCFPSWILLGISFEYHCPIVTIIVQFWISLWILHIRPFETHSSELHSDGFEIKARPFNFKKWNILGNFQYLSCVSSWWPTMTRQNRERELLFRF